MEKVEFMLDNNDFNHLCEITANEGTVVQVVGNRAMYKTQQDRAVAIWKTFGEKYGFIPETIECNLPNRDARYFLALPVIKSEEIREKVCSLCNTVVQLIPTGGCSRSHMRGCVFAIEKPKKLIRDKIVDVLKDGEWEKVDDKEQLNALFFMKVDEELDEIRRSKCNDVKEFADLINVAFKFAELNGFTKKSITEVIIEKENDKGTFSNVVLTNLNPNNPSNKVYFDGKKG